MRYYGGAVK